MTTSTLVYSTDWPNATVVRTTEYGDIVVKVDGDPIPITTRSCFLIP
jgi:hypothetical protein